MTDHHDRAPQGGGPAWRDRELPTPDRVVALLADLDDAERTALVLADFGPLGARGLPHPHYVDSGTGLRGVAGATAYPVGIALAATFDVELAGRYGAAVAREARAAGYTCVLGPTVDLARDPRAGRIPEALGEDPWLSGALGAAHVRGLQGEHVIAQVKHYLAYGTEERRTGHGPVWRRGPAVDVLADDHVIETYLGPFRAVVEAGAWSLMGSYNRVNGEYVCESPDLLAIPRERWDWPGFYAPDFIFAVRNPAAALAAGLDLPGLDGAAGRTTEMVHEAGPVARDAAVRRVLTALIGSGLVDDPPQAGGPVSAESHRDLAREAVVSSTVLLRNEGGLLPLADDVRRIAVIGPAGADALLTAGGSSAVTIDTTRVVTLVDAVTARAGGAAEVVVAQGSLGDTVLPPVPPTALSLPDGSGPGVEVHRGAPDGSQTVQTIPTFDLTVAAEDVEERFPHVVRTLVTPTLSGRHRLSLDVGGRVTMRVDGRVVARGAREASPFFDGPSCPLQAVVDLDAGRPALVEVAWEIGPALVVPEMGLLPKAVLGWQPPDDLLAEAVETARGCDVAVVVVNAASSEGMDREGLALPGDQEDLVCAVAAANPRTVVVLNTPGAVTMPWLGDVAGVLQVWYPGEQFGPALASILFGDASPAGRLPLTFPVSHEDLPGGGRQAGDSPERVELSEGDCFGHRADGVQRHGPLFPFGFGLGYGSTTHTVVDVRRTDRLEVDLGLSNAGIRDAVHVAQAYVAPTDEPMRRYLCGVARAEVPAGGEVDVVLAIDPRDLDEVLPAGRRRLVVATHAADPGTEVDEPQHPVPAAAPTTPTSDG